MIAALNSQFPDLEVSVLTGYRDFEYAKEAIRLGVTRFLLKPSNMDELEEAIECMCANLNLAHFSRVFKNRLGYRRTNTAIRCLENRSKSTIIRKKYDSAEEKCEKICHIY